MDASLEPNAAAPPLEPGTKFWYAIGQAAEGLKNEAFSLFLLFYYTQVVGLSGALSGRAILIALLFDAVTDPLAGTLSDRLDSRWGRRHPFLYASALPVSVCFYLVFTPPARLEPLGLFAWLAVFAVLTRLSMTLFHVPYLALGAELSADYEERTRIVTLRMLCARIGHAVAGALGLLVFMRPSADYPSGQLDPAAYPPFAASLAVLIFGLILMSALRTHHRVPHLARPDLRSRGRGVTRTLLRDGWESLTHRSFRALFFGSTLAFVSWGITVSLSLHLGTYFWMATTDQLFLWGVCSATGIFVGLGYWSRLAERWDKRPVFIVGLLVYTAFTAVPALLKVLGFWPGLAHPLYIPAFVLTTGLVASFGVASTMVTGGSMMADVTDEDALVYGRRREGIFFGAISFASKASFGIGSQLAGIAVDAVGLTPGLRPEEVGPSVVRDLGLTLGAATLLLVGISVAIFARYDLTRSRHAQIRAALDERA